MKTEIEILNDVFGKNKSTFSKRDFVKSMSIFSNQFRWVKTTCGKEIIFDDLDYDVLRQQKIFFVENRNHVMAVWESKNGKKTVAPIAKLLLGIEGKSIIKYKDDNPLNLKRKNIELINHQVSQFKQKLPKNSTSGYKGVSWNKFAKKYSAHIKIDYKKIHLGYFVDAIDGAKAYNKKAKEIFGEDYSELNVIAE